MTHVMIVNEPTFYICHAPMVTGAVLLEAGLRSCRIPPFLAPTLPHPHVLSLSSEARVPHRGDWELPTPLQRGNAETEAKGRSKKCGRCRRKLEPIGRHDNAGSEQRRDSVQLCAQHDRDICQQNVPSDSTSDAGQHASNVAMTGLSPCDSALSAPDTAKRASPPASNTSTALERRTTAEGKKNVIPPTASDTAR